MKKSLYLWILLMFSLFGCQGSEEQHHSSENKEVTRMTDEKLYDITYLFEAPTSKVNQRVDKVIKIVSTKGRSTPEETIAIDIQNKKIYLEPRIAATGIEAKTGSVPVSDTNEVISFLEKYNVQDWPKEETNHYSDGDNKSLWLQFANGTVQKYNETEIIEIMQSDTFNKLLQELKEFVDARVITIDPNIK